MSNPNAIVDHCLVHKLGVQTTLDFREPKKKEKTRQLQ